MGVVAAIVTAAAYLVLVGSAVVGAPHAFAVALAFCAVGECWVARRSPLVSWGLARLTLQPVWRWAVMTGALLLLSTTIPGTPPATGSWVLAGSLVTAVAYAALEGAALVVAHLRKSPLLSRNLALEGLDLPRSPRPLLRWAGGLVWPAQVTLVGAAALVLAGALPRGTAVGGAVVAMMGSVALVGWAAFAVLSARRSTLRRRLPEAIQAAVKAHAPDVVLYHGGPPSTLYQLEMWLPVMERSAHRTLVVMRHRESWRRLAPTTLPVVCAAADTVLTNLDLGSVRAALFVANGSTNIHLLRLGGMRTAFIGHGDSDKASSRNPFVKVYDEIWVAGPAGRQRYAGPQTQAVVDLVREVGRPQAAPPGTPWPEREDGRLTVVYAPTWEGWGDDPHHSSLRADGLPIVRALLQTPGVRVVYRPHPLTGTRDRGVRRAHERVVAELRRAGAPAEQRPRRGDPTDRLDDVDLIRGGSRCEARAMASSWAQRDPGTHRVAGGDWPDLATVLRDADLLVCDVSGVLSDWLALDRPLAVANPGGLPTAEFRSRFPSSRSGLVLGPGGAGLRELAEDLARGDDPTERGRAQVREELLGPADPEGRRFEAALDAITSCSEGP
ncbi:hypothetical protein [Pedococcus sp. 5OH_020]|uniref:hypothetical protein n=1 Tax=Pedococcus sp. 5OH_020 TaxID=2989814 RepID=UPI0022EA0A19|nr:hypothetical protein [Pedococcus sp. 5OH_020]